MKGLSPIKFRKRHQEALILSIHKDLPVTHTHTHTDKLTTITLCLCAWVNDPGPMYYYVIVIEHLQVNYVVIKHEGQCHSDRGVAEVTMATPRVFY